MNETETIADLKKRLTAMIRTAKLIKEQVEHAKNLDAISMRGALITASLLSDNIIDEGEGY